MSWWSRFFGTASVTPAVPTNAKNLKEKNLLKEVYPNTNNGSNNNNSTDPEPLNNSPANRRANTMNRRNMQMYNEENLYSKVYPNGRNNRAYSQSNNFNNAEALPPATLAVTGGSRRGRGTFARRGRAKRSTKRRRNAKRSSSRR